MFGSRVKVAAAAAVLGVAGFSAAAVAGGGRDFETDLHGFEEVPTVSSGAGGQMEAENNRAGTEIRFHLNAGGRTRQYHGHVTEPEPGRVLAERYADGGVTTFTVTPEGSGSRVRIETTAEAKGISGVVARVLAPRLLRPLFTDELARLDQYTQTQA